METKQIYTALEKIFSGKRVDFNVIPCDYLSSLQVDTYPTCLVVNNKPSTHSGEHWLGMFMENPTSPLIFFCSYGLGIATYGKFFTNFVNNQRLQVIENNRTLQSINATTCGYYCIYFLYKMVNGCCLMSMYCTFSRNTESNDVKVKHFVRKHAKSNLEGRNINLCCVNQCCKSFKQI
jgi:hypothetical protein